MKQALDSFQEKDRQAERKRKRKGLKSTEGVTEKKEGVKE